MTEERDAAHWEHPTATNLVLVRRGPLADLWEEVRGQSHHEFRFLDSVYSPTSCVPCADFTPFIIQRIREDDVASVQGLMRFIVDGNRGLGADLKPEWVDAPVEEVVRTDWSQYCQSDDPDFELELKALLILGLNHGISNGHWLASTESSLLALALCRHDIRWQLGLRRLVEKANDFILEMRKELPFWQGIPLLYPGEAQFPVDGLEAANALASVSALSRIPLLAMASKKVAAPLMHATTYNMRRLGIHMSSAAPELIARGLCEPTLDLNAVASLYTKKDLFAVMDVHAVPHRKSWSKQKLTEALALAAPQVVADAADRAKVARIAPRYLSGLRVLRGYANALEDYIRPIAFALTKPAS